MVLAEMPRNRALPFDLGLVNRRGLSANSARGLKYLQYSRGAATMLLGPALIAPPRFRPVVEVADRCTIGHQGIHDVVRKIVQANLPLLPVHLAGGPGVI